MFFYKYDCLYNYVFLTSMIFFTIIFVFYKYDFLYN